MNWERIIRIALGILVMLVSAWLSYDNSWFSYDGAVAYTGSVLLTIFLVGTTGLGIYAIAVDYIEA